MFSDLFDFGKKRTLRESIGFYLFYVSLFAAGSAFISLLGNG